MPRPKTVDDETILAAVINVVERDGPAVYTLASVAKEVGLSAASLVQRFGTKRALLLAADRWAVERWVAGMDAPPADLPALSRLVQGMVHTVDPAVTPTELANSVSLLQIGLTDPEFHSSTRGGALRIRAKVTECLRLAREEGDLRERRRRRRARRPSRGHVPRCADRVGNPSGRRCGHLGH